MREAGELPNLKRLMGEGAYGDLTSTIPPIIPVAWTSFMTGKNPGKHGTFGFFEPVPNSYTVRRRNGGSRRAKTIWRILSESDKLTIALAHEPAQNDLPCSLD